MSLISFVNKNSFFSLFLLTGELAIFSQKSISSFFSLRLSALKALKIQPKYFYNLFFVRVNFASTLLHSSRQLSNLPLLLLCLSLLRFALISKCSLSVPLLSQLTLFSLPLIVLPALLYSYFFSSSTVRKQQTWLSLVIFTSEVIPYRITQA